MKYQVKKFRRGWLVNERKHGTIAMIGGGVEIHDMRHGSERLIFNDGSLLFTWNYSIHGHQLDNGDTGFIDTFVSGKMQGISYRR